MNKSFPCTACGQCCRRVHLSEQTAYLNRGDGMCLHFDEQTNLCEIYEHRPLVCQVENYYQHYLTEVFDWDDFVKINLEACKTLQKLAE